MNQVGEVRETGNGIVLTTPAGEFCMTELEALEIAGDLSSTVRHRLGRPWSNEDPSSILSRGLRHGLPGD